MATGISVDTSRFCFLDLVFNNQREKLATAAAFVAATDSRYGFSSKDLKLLGGSEVSRIKELISTDHEWSSKASSIETHFPAGGNRVVVELFWDVAPMACENFATLCSNGSLMPGSKDKKAKPAPIGTSGKPLTYRGSIMHRCMPGFVLQGGDFVLGNGSGGESIFNGKKFKDERGGLALKHDQKYILSMGNSGKNANSSQFFFTFQPAPQCDGKHVIFGRVISGFSVIDAAEKFGSSSGETTVPICITDCGVYEPFQTPGSGYWYDTPDPESFSGVSPTFMTLPRVVVFAVNTAVLDKFEKAMGEAVIMSRVSAEEYSEEESQTSRLEELLGNFAVDVILIAPACKSIIAKIALPQAWIDANVPVNKVILETKPLVALTCVRTKSWLSKKGWRLEGT